MNNSMKISFDAYPQNEGFARVAVAAFMAYLDPTVDEMEDVKTAVSEAVTNSIIHGYGQGEKNDKPAGSVDMEMSVCDREVAIIIRDYGVGICDIKKAMEPLYTSKPEMERSGMGFTFMEAFMDKVSVESVVGEGTTVTLHKKIK